MGIKVDKLKELVKEAVKEVISKNDDDIDVEVIDSLLEEKENEIKKGQLAQREKDELIESLKKEKSKLALTPNKIEKSKSEDGVEKTKPKTIAELLSKWGK